MADRRLMPVRRIRREAQTGPRAAWELVRAEPAEHLRPHVAGYTGWWERTHDPVLRTEVPVAEVPLIMSFGPPTLIHDAARPDAAPARLTSFAAGLYGRAVKVGHEGLGDAVQIDLTPLAARRFLRMPLGELSHRTVELVDLLGPQADRLIEALALEETWEARFDLLDRTLTRRIRDGSPAPADVTWAWARLAASGGQVRVAELAAELRCSRRHLTARFQAELGLPPKAVARVMRFQRALALRRAGADWAQIAYDCGYSDQPHLNRDFRDLAGATPGELSAALPVPFVQDAGPART